jgi:hypothetical protein
MYFRYRVLDDDALDLGHGVWKTNSPIYYSSAEKTLKGAIFDFFWMVLGNLTETSYFGGI